jgi:hypothetical protein
VKHTAHSYRAGVRGRSIATRPGVGGVSITARMQCARCPKIGELGCRQIMPPEQMDKKFTQAGWSLDPNTCPDCIRAITEEKTMAPKPTHAAMKAQAQMFHALSEHFDPETGQYAAGWSDQKVATDTGLAPDVVAEFRKAGFGELKELPALATLRADIFSLEQLQREHHDTVTKEIAALRGRLSRVSTGGAA